MNAVQETYNPNPTTTRLVLWNSLVNSPHLYHYIATLQMQHLFENLPEAMNTHFGW